MPSSIGIQYTLKTTFTGKHVLYVRKSVPAMGPGDFVWTKWRKATIAERDKALFELMGLNIG